MTKYDQTRVDSAATWEKLALTYYQYGHYYKAEEGYKRLIVMDSTRAQYYQIMGNLMLMDARYDMAWGKLDAVVSIDSTYATARLLQAKILAIKADTGQAIKLAEKFYPVEKSTPGKIEFQLFLGKMYGAKGSNFDSTAANKYFTNALAWSSDMAAKAPEDPTYKLRMGLAYLGLEDFENAEKYLELALFFERRPFHQGEALIGLGNLYDLSQNHKKAIEFYQRALTLPLAAYQRDLCIKYIDQPYRK
ncbi:MAG: tetratricopeptide repeat protein [candidate division Zixibacteria bacterium]|nr:tetratricopeptide repeat protein [candidate division Zixibacteria bacterium]